MHNNNFMDNEMSLGEKEILCKIINESDHLPYRIISQEGSDGYLYEVYDIPQEEVVKNIYQCYPFTDIPQNNGECFCLHARELFNMEDAKIIRYHNRNIPVSADFLRTGGTCLDWLPPIDCALIQEKDKEEK